MPKYSSSNRVLGTGAPIQLSIATTPAGSVAGEKAATVSAAEEQIELFAVSEHTLSGNTHAFKRGAVPPEQAGSSGMTSTRRR